jgi:hypothetical protein
MEIKLTYNSVYEFSTTDYGDATDPPLTFEAHARPPVEWGDLIGTWILDLDPMNIDKAIEAVSYAIISVSQNGCRYPVGNKEGAWALHAAIEKSNPGEGDAFMVGLALGHYNHRWRRLRDLSGNLETPSPPSDDGNNQEE